MAGLVDRYRAARGEIQSAVTAALQRGGATIVREMTPKIPVKTGALRRSVMFDVQDWTLDVGVGTPSGGRLLAYARMREFGGTIKPTNARYLAFPAPGSPVLTKSGVGGIRARDVFENPSVAGVDRVWINKRRTAILGAKDGGPVVPLFVLRRQVTQRGSEFFYPTIEANRSRIVESVRKAIFAAVEG